MEEKDVKILLEDMVDKNGNKINANVLAGIYDSAFSLRHYFSRCTDYTKEEIGELSRYINKLDGNDYNFQEISEIKRKIENYDWNLDEPHSKHEEPKYSTVENSEQKPTEDTEEKNKGLKYPVSIYRKSKVAASLRSLKVLIDGQEIADLHNGERIKLQIESGKHKVSFYFGRKEANSLTFVVDDNNSGTSIICYVKSNISTNIKVEAYVSKVIVEEAHDNCTTEKNIKKAGWKQIPLFIRIVIWLFAIGFLLEFLVGFLWGVSIGLS